MDRNLFSKESSQSKKVETPARVERYRHLTLADLKSSVFGWLRRDRIALVNAPGANGAESEIAVVGGAFCAFVSDKVDAKIKEQIRLGVCPIRLKPEDWTSGAHAWLLDVVTPLRTLVSDVPANFRQLSKSKELRVHPAILRTVSMEDPRNADYASILARNAPADRSR